MQESHGLGLLWPRSRLSRAHRERRTPRADHQEDSPLDRQPTAGPVAETALFPGLALSTSGGDGWRELDHTWLLLVIVPILV
jgi:hypothetical protein